MKKQERMIKMAGILGNKEALDIIAGSEKIAKVKTESPYKENAEALVKLAEAGVPEAADFLVKFESVFPGLGDEMCKSAGMAQRQGMSPMSKALMMGGLGAGAIGAGYAMGHPGGMGDLMEGAGQYVDKFRDQAAHAIAPGTPMEEAGRTIGQEAHNGMNSLQGALSEKANEIRQGALSEKANEIRQGVQNGMQNVWNRFSGMANSLKEESARKLQAGPSQMMDETGYGAD